MTFARIRPLVARAMRRPFWLTLLAAFLISAAAPGYAQDDGPLPIASYDYLAERAAHPTHLLRHGPAPQAFQAEAPPAGARRVAYQSGGRELWGLMALPASRSGGVATPTARPVPAIVYAHGGFAFGNDDFEAVRPFLDRGFAVFTPTLRGENGNPGDFELMFGEVDDLLRSMVPHVRQLVHRHVAFIGSREPLAAQAAANNAQARRLGAPLEVRVVPGDHYQALTPAVLGFLDLIENHDL
jgi:hypothetical protein